MVDAHHNCWEVSSNGVKKQKIMESVETWALLLSTTKLLNESCVANLFFIMQQTPDNNINFDCQKVGKILDKI